MQNVSTRTSYVGMSRLQATRVMHRLSQRFGGADMERADGGTNAVRFACWHPVEDAFLRGSVDRRYCGTEFVVYTPDEADAYIADESLLTIDEASSMLARLGMAAPR